MAIGLGVLRLSPRDFWSMTLLELAAASRGARGGGIEEALARDTLAELMLSYPDTPDKS